MNEVAIRSQIVATGNVKAIVPTTIDEAYRMSEAVFLAGMYPDDCKAPSPKETASRIMMKIMKGSEVGFPPMTALATILIVNNRPAIWGDGALAVCQNHRDFLGCKEWTEGEMNMTEKSNWAAKCEISRRIGGETKTTTRQFSWSDAMRAGLHRKGTYQQYPGRMIQMRARAWCIRDSFADALSGLGIVEEVQDIPQKAQEVSTAFLDDAGANGVPTAQGAGESSLEESTDSRTETVVEATPATELSSTVAEPAIDPKALLTSIKKDFVKAGDDIERIAQIVQAAEGLDLPEPFGGELKNIIAAKKAKLNQGENK